MEIDFSRVPMGELHARQLVDALAETDDRAERHFLEVKSHIDLKSKEGLAKVAKFILGAGNRMPDIAARYFEGHAVMVLGVEPGGTPGIEPVEALDIERGVRPFLSVHGPVWDLQRVPVADGREVLLIIVDPPKAGDPAFPCFKDGHGLHNGQIIVRADGETRQATGEEALLLQQRGRLTPTSVELKVAGEGVALRYSCDAGVLDEYIAATRSRLESARLHNGYPFSAASSLGRGSSIDRVFSTPEDRTPEDYAQQITAWEQRCRSAWVPALEKVCATFGPKFTLLVTNMQDSFLEDVELQVHLAGAVRGLEREDPSRFDDDRFLPLPPREWGPRSNNFAGIDFPGLAHMGMPSVGYLPASPSTFTFRNGGSVDIDAVVGDLRPRQTFSTEDDEEIVLVVDDPSLTEIRGEWKITARGHNAVYEGEFTVPVVSRDITDLVSRIVNPPDPENEQMD